jgi:hypothetical protein
MTALNLTEEETTLLLEVLESSLMDLRTERLRTEKRDLHAAVAEREHVVADVIRRLQVAANEAPMTPEQANVIAP